jgi:beta-glucosidase
VWVALGLGLALGGLGLGLTDLHRPAAASSSIYLDPHYSPAERAADLVSRLTVAEKAAQMNSSLAPAVPRLGIAQLSWWNEAAHGVAREGVKTDANPDVLTNTTSYPVDLSLGSTWNPGLMYDEASAISDEAREVARDNRFGLNYYSPTVNLARDPRWGRGDETFSEDPVLTARMAGQYVNGLQGADQRGRPLPEGRGYLKAAATLKHFAANNSEFNRLTGSSDMDERTLREYYTAQFRALVRDSRPASIMSAYNEVNGTPAAASIPLIDTLARQTFGFGGFFTSDCDAVYIIQSGHRWQPPGTDHPLDEIERNAWANAAGEDLNCQQGYHDDVNFGNALPTAIGRGIVTPAGTYSENDLDVSLVRLFTARIATGEFDQQSRVPWVARARARVARGTWVNSDANGAVTQTRSRLVLARRVADESIVLLRNDTASLPLKVPATGPFRIAVIGPFAHPDKVYLGGYSSNQGPAGQARTVDAYTGLKTYVQAINPRAAVDFLSGVDPRDVDQVDEKAVDAAAGYDVVVVCVGTDPTNGDEGVDRESLDLPGAQAQLVREVSARNRRTIVYAETGGQFTVAPLGANVPTLLWSSYNGQRKGEALADVLLGRRNPSGHLPFTWYRNEADLPPVGDYAIHPGPTGPGRTYQYFRRPVSFPFGHGLSYTGFRVRPAVAIPARADANASITVTTRVTNVGSVPGAQVVQLYAATPDAPASAQRPVRRLVDFRKVQLLPGASATLHFTVRLPDLAFFQGDRTRGRWVVDPGRYAFSVGTSSADLQHPAVVSVRGALRTEPSVVTVKPVTGADAAGGIAQRTLFRPGDAIDPRVSVAMNDDTLYGWIGPHRSRHLPAGLKLAYRSNRPEVADTAGSRRAPVRARAPGVATITVDVTYHGRTRSGWFVVLVR